MFGMSVKDTCHIWSGRVDPGVNMQRRVNVDVFAGQHVQFEIGLVDQIGGYFTEAEIVDMEIESLCTWQSRRKMTAHTARLAKHIDDIKGEQELLTERGCFIAGVDFTDIGHANDLTGYLGTPACVSIS